MLDNPIEAENVSVKSFEDTDTHTVENRFDCWKTGNPDCVILDISYRSWMAPIREAQGGEMFRLYTITLVYAEKVTPIIST